MGTKKGVFVNIVGDTISVEFTGDKVADKADVLFGVQPIVLSMGGTAGGFEPIKYKTGTITVIAEADEYADLMTTSALDVRVMVRNDTKHTVLFYGVVSPNTYSQDVNDINNELSIEVVDCLGAAKLLPYPLYDGLGFSVLTLHQVISHIQAEFFWKLGPVWYPYTLRVMPGHYNHNPEDGSPYYMEMSVAESAFFGGEIAPYSPAISENSSEPVRWPANPVTCYDVLEMIAKSLLFTLVQEGDKWIFVDYIQVTQSVLRPQIVAAGPPDGYEYDVASTIASNVLVDASSEVGSLSISSAPKYGRFSIDNGYTADTPVMPPLFDEALLSPVGEMHEEYEREDEDLTQWQEVESICYDTLAPYDVDGYKRGSRLVAVSTRKRGRVFGDPPALLFAGEQSWKTSLAVYLTPTAPSADNPVVVLSKKATFPIAANGREGVGLSIKLSLSVAEGWHDFPPAELYKEDKNLFDFIRLRVRVGEKYFDPKAASDGLDGRVYYWHPGPVARGVAFNPSTADDWMWCDNGTEVLLLWNVNPVAVRELYDDTSYGAISGDVSVEILAGKGFAGQQTTLFISEFEVATHAGIHDTLATSKLIESAPLTLVTDAAGDELDAIELPLNVCWPHSAGYLSPFIFGQNFVGTEDVAVGSKTVQRHVTTLAYFRHADADEAYYRTSINRLALLANLGDAFSCEYSICDEADDIKAYSRVTVNGRFHGVKHVVSYEEDIINNQKTIVVL